MTVPKKYFLDFAALPGDSTFETRSLLTTLPDVLEARLAALPQILERVQGAVMFAEQAAQQTEASRAAAFLRAALVDYCSIEEMQYIDKPSSPHLRLADLKSPLLHLLDLMRHMNIHVKTGQATPHSVTATFKEHTIVLDVFVISSLDAVELIKLRNGKRYSLSDIQMAIDWFQRVQLYWGAGYVIRVGVEYLAQELCAHYCL